LYAPSKLLEQVEKQAKAEFNGELTHFEWWNEEEYTTIMVEISSTTWRIEVGDRIRQLVNSIVGDQYIVAITVSPIESVSATDGLFNLTYNGGLNTFFVDYYAPERPRLSYTEGANPLRVSIFYTRMIKALRRVHLDSPSELWAQLFRPIQEVLAQRRGVHSFCKDLAPDLRDFLLDHLDFIERMMQASGETLQVLPAPVSLLPQSPLANRRKPSLARKHAVTSQQELALPTAVAA